MIQPSDMSYVLTRLLALDDQPHNPFSGLIDGQEIAAAGQSDGGDTVAALAANPCCTDHRVKAAAVLSGAEWPPMPGRYFARGAPPMLFVQGTADTINPPRTSRQFYQQNRSPAKCYLGLFGANHLIPYWGGPDGAAGGPGHPGLFRPLRARPGPCTGHDDLGWRGPRHGRPVRRRPAATVTQPARHRYVSAGSTGRCRH